MEAVRRSQNASLALSLAALVLGMTLLAFATPPLYRMFCQATGFGGTPRQSDEAASQVLARDMNVHFNADAEPGLPVRFHALSKDVTFKIGETQLIEYEVENLGAEPLRIQATYNVTPDKAGKYFTKLQCFCFENVDIKPGERIPLPVSFFIDPSIADDPAMDDVTYMTLSYTFFNVSERK